MKQLVLKIDDNRYALFLQFLKTLSYVHIEQPVQTSQILEEPSMPYNFSDLVGKLEWKGDAVTEQRRLRDEW